MIGEHPDLAGADAALRRRTRATAGHGGHHDYPSYSDRALREAIVNAVVHRDYEIGNSQIILRLFSDRIEFRNPGALHERAAASCHIAMIGDSYVEARQVPIADKFHVRLEELAARELRHLDITTSAFGIMGKCAHSGWFERARGSGPTHQGFRDARRGRDHHATTAPSPFSGVPIGHHPIGAAGANPVETTMLKVVDGRFDRRVLAPGLGECLCFLALALGHTKPALARQCIEVEHRVEPHPVVGTFDVGSQAHGDSRSHNQDPV